MKNQNEIEKEYKKWLESDIDNYGTIGDQKVGFIAGFKCSQSKQKDVLKVFVATDSNGKVGVFYTLKQAEEYLKECNLGEMPKFDGTINGMRAYIGINEEESYIQSYDLKKRIEQNE